MSDNLFKAKKGYFKRRFSPKGTRKRPLTTKRLLNQFSYRYGRLSSEEKQEIERKFDEYGINFMTPYELRHAKNLTKEDIRYNIGRFYAIQTGEYEKARKDLFIQNYVKGLENAGVRESYIRRFRKIAKSLSPQELSMIVRDGSLPNVFIFYEALDEGERAYLLEDDLDTFFEAYEKWKGLVI